MLFCIAYRFLTYDAGFLKFKYLMLEHRIPLGLYPYLSTLCQIYISSNLTNNGGAIIEWYKVTFRNLHIPSVAEQTINLHLNSGIH